MKAIRFKIQGMVQGVGFRYYTQRAADKIGVKGYVKNLPDGSVESMAIGTEDQLTEYTKALWRGPASSSVDHISEVFVENFDQYTGFRIEF